MPVVQGICTVLAATIAAGVATTVFVLTGRREARRERVRLRIAEQDKKLDALSQLLANTVIYFHAVQSLLADTVKGLNDRTDTDRASFQALEAVAKSARNREFETICRERQVELLRLAETYGTIPSRMNGEARDLGAWLEEVTDTCQDPMQHVAHRADFPLTDIRQDLVDDLRALKSYHTEAKQALIRDENPPVFASELAMTHGTSLHVRWNDRLPPRVKGRIFLPKEDRENREAELEIERARA